MKGPLLMLVMIGGMQVGFAQTDKIFIPDGQSSIHLGTGELISFAGGAEVTSNTLDYSGTLHMRGDFKGQYKINRAVVFGGGTTNMVTDPGTLLQIVQGLKVQGGTTFNANNETTILSTASGTGNVEELSPTDNITNQLTMQRYIPGGRRAYRIFGHPFTSSKSLYETLQDDFDVTGPGGYTNGFVATQTNAPSAWYFNPLTGAWVSYTSAYAPAGNWNQYQGVYAMVRGAKGEGIFGQQNYTVSETTVDFTGEINQHGVTIPLVTTTTPSALNYNLVGNPYPSDVDLTAAIGTLSNNAWSAYWVWNSTMVQSGLTNQNNMPVYGKFEAILNAAPMVLPSSSAFMVAVSAADNITFQESYKSTGTPHAGLFKTTTGSEILELKVFSDTNTFYWDKMYLVIDANASDSEEVHDASKPLGGNVNLFAYSADGKKQSVGAFPYGLGKVVPLGFPSTELRTFTFQVSAFTIDATHPLYLHDKYLNTLTQLQANTSYTFTVTNDTNTSTNRFEIGMGAVPLSINLLSFNGEKQEQGNRLHWTTTKEASGDRFELQRSNDGKEFDALYNTAAKGAASDYNFIDMQPFNGNNFYRLKMSNAAGDFVYSRTVLINNTRMDAINYSLYPNPSAGPFTIVCSAPLPEAATVTVMDVQGRTVLNAQAAMGTEKLQLDCTTLAQGLYKVLITTDSGNKKILDLIRK